MVNKKHRLRELETELAEHYRQYPGATVNNTYTQGAWREIEALIAEVEG